MTNKENIMHFVPALVPQVLKMNLQVDKYIRLDKCEGVCQSSEAQRTYSVQQRQYILERCAIYIQDVLLLIQLIRKPIQTVHYMNFNTLISHYPAFS